MDHTVGLAVRAGVAIGAHPGHADLRGFGRRAIQAAPDEIERDVLYQVGALQAFARAHGTRVVHVKPHGALYNQAAEDEAVARAIARGVARAGRDLILVGLASTGADAAGRAGGGAALRGGSVRRSPLHAAGTLQSRREPGLRPRRSRGGGGPGGEDRHGGTRDRDGRKRGRAAGGHAVPPRRQPGGGGQRAPPSAARWRRRAWTSARSRL